MLLGHIFGALAIDWTARTYGTDAFSVAANQRTSPGFQNPPGSSATPPARRLDR
jgi:hypothetical protein